MGQNQTSSATTQFSEQEGRGSIPPHKGEKIIVDVPSVSNSSRPWYYVETKRFQCNYCWHYSTESMIDCPNKCFSCAMKKSWRYCQVCNEKIIKPELAAHQVKCYKENLMVKLKGVKKVEGDHETQEGGTEKHAPDNQEERKGLTFASLPQEVLGYIVSFATPTEQEALFYLSSNLHRACMYWLADSKAKAYVDASGHMKNNRFMMGHDIPPGFKGGSAFRYTLSTCGMGEHLLDAIFSKSEYISLNGLDRQVQLTFQPDWAVGPPFPRVHTLQAKYCDLSSDVLRTLLSRLPNLTHLNLRGSKVLTLNDVSVIVTLLPRLEYISLQETCVEHQIQKIFRAEEDLKDWKTKKTQYDAAVRNSKSSKGHRAEPPGPQPEIPPREAWMLKNPFSSNCVIGFSEETLSWLRKEGLIPEERQKRPIKKENLKE